MGGNTQAAHDDDLCFTPATVLATALRDKKLSPVELMRAILDRIDRVNPKINAFVTLIGEQALAAASVAERQFSSTPSAEVDPLCGLPVTVKDMTLTAGVRTTFGSRHFANYIPTEDGLIWARLKARGAILLGKTTTPEFGNHSVTESPLTGITSNPWDISRTTGGSSGGAAAAVAAGMGPLATGSDGGGSIRVPASYCGVVGLKASLGRIPLIRKGSAFDTVTVEGPITRTVADTAMILSAVAGPHPYDPYSLLETDVDYVGLLRGASVRGLPVAFSPDLGNPPIERNVAAALARAADVFDHVLGARVEQIDINLPDPMEYFAKWWGPYIVLELDDQALSGGGDRTDCHPAFLSFADRARGMTAVEHARTEMYERERIHHAFADVFLRHDLLLMPTTPSVAFPHPGPEGGPAEVAGKRVAEPVLDNQRCTEAISHAGYPAVTVPCGFTDEGLPVGLQIAGPHGADAAILRAAAAFEEAMPWADRRPAL